MLDPDPCLKDISSSTIHSHYPILQIKQNSILFLLLQKNMYFFRTLTTKKSLSRRSRREWCHKREGKSVSRALQAPKTPWRDIPKVSFGFGFYWVLMVITRVIQVGPKSESHRVKMINYSLRGLSEKGRRNTGWNGVWSYSEGDREKRIHENSGQKRITVEQA